MSTIPPQDHRRLRVAGVARLWRATLTPGSERDYERFARDVSLPMFMSHKGYLGAAMMRRETTALVITYWADMKAVSELEQSPSYIATVAAIRATGFIAVFGETDVMLPHIFHVAGEAIG